MWCHARVFKATGSAAIAQAFIYTPQTSTLHLLAATVLSSFRACARLAGGIVATPLDIGRSRAQGLDGPTGSLVLMTQELAAVTVGGMHGQ